VIQVDKKTIYIIVAIIAIIVVAVAAVALLMNNDEAPDTLPEPATVVGAESLQFTATESTGAVYEFSIRGVNEADQELRVDMTIDGETYNYVIKLADQTSFMSMDGETWFASDFAEDSGIYVVMAADFIAALEEDWNGLDAQQNVTIEAGDYVVSNIRVNPSLNDSLFATS